MSEKLDKLLALDVNNKTEKKNNLTYLSWAWAWAEFLKVYPLATYTIKKNENGMPYFKDGSGAFVFTSVTAENITHEMWLPVMNHSNKAIKDPDAFEINKTAMRCLTKNLAMLGLGLYIYAGEDLPEPSKEALEQKEAEAESKVLEIESLIVESGADRQKFLQHFHVNSIEELDYEKAVQALKVKIQKKKLDEEKLAEAS